MMIYGQNCVKPLRYAAEPKIKEDEEKAQYLLYHIIVAYSKREKIQNIPHSFKNQTMKRNKKVKKPNPVEQSSDGSGMNYEIKII